MSNIGINPCHERRKWYVRAGLTQKRKSVKRNTPNTYKINLHNKSLLSKNRDLCVCVISNHFFVDELRLSLSMFTKEKLGILNEPFRTWKFGFLRGIILFFSVGTRDKNVKGARMPIGLLAVRRLGLQKPLSYRSLEWFCNQTLDFHDWLYF